MGKYKYAILGAIVGVIMIEIEKSYNLILLYPTVTILFIYIISKYIITNFKNRKISKL